MASLVGSANVVCRVPVRPSLCCLTSWRAGYGMGPMTELMSEAVMGRRHGRLNCPAYFVRALEHASCAGRPSTKLQQASSLSYLQAVFCQLNIWCLLVV
jgi:hypothetical protein